MKSERNILFIVWFIVLFFGIIGEPVAAQDMSDPLVQMEIAFEGDYIRVQIKQRLDKAMDLYNLPKTQENYSRAGSVLVTLRKEYGQSEMAILDYMIRSHVSGVEMNFSDAAAIAVTFLVAGDR